MSKEELQKAKASRELGEKDKLKAKDLIGRSLRPTPPEFRPRKTPIKKQKAIPEGSIFDILREKTRRQE